MVVFNLVDVIRIKVTAELGGSFHRLDDGRIEWKSGVRVKVGQMLFETEIKERNLRRCVDFN